MTNMTHLIVGARIPEGNPAHPFYGHLYLHAGKKTLGFTHSTHGSAPLENLVMTDERITFTQRVVNSGPVFHFTFSEKEENVWKGTYTGSDEGTAWIRIEEFPSPYTEPPK